MQSTLSRLPLRFAVVCLFACGLAATDTAAAFAQEGAPQTTLSALTATGSTTITVSGFVVPGSSVTSFVVDYGTSPSFGQSTPPVSIGSLPQPIPVNETLSGLTPGTTYYAQILATSGAGTGSSATMSATTSGPATGTAPASARLSASALPHRGLEQDSLAGVSCVSGSFCLAVGQGGSHRTGSGGVAERFNGGSWRLAASRLGGSQSALSSVSCVSASFCLAVGHTIRGTLAERFNGRSFSRVRTVSPAGPGVDVLSSVACLSKSNCWAVGLIRGGLNTPASSLVEHWNGRSFTVASAPRRSGYMTSVSCTSAADCWAVGTPGTAEHYNGHKWTGVSLPGSLSAHQGAFVSCGATSMCWILGVRESRTSPPNPVALHLVGGSWEVVGMPSGPLGPHAASNFIDGAACASSSDCWTAGESARGAPGSPPTSAPFAEQWNGSSWTVAHVSAPSGPQSLLEGVSCAPGGPCVAVGSTGSASQSAGVSGSAMVAVSKPL